MRTKVLRRFIGADVRALRALLDWRVEGNSFAGTGMGKDTKILLDVRRTSVFAGQNFTSVLVLLMACFFFDENLQRSFLTLCASRRVP